MGMAAEFVVPVLEALLVEGFVPVGLVPLVVGPAVVPERTVWPPAPPP
jgi:hypothetical protein